jgi:hypothetical protein
MNASVLKKMEAFFAAGEGLPLSLAQTFLTSDVSVTFMDLMFPTQHTWALSNTSDSTVVIAGDLCVGYPRSLSSDPSRVPVFELARLSRLLRPVLL